MIWVLGTAMGIHPQNINRNCKCRDPTFFCIGTLDPLGPKDLFLVFKVGSMSTSLRFTGRFMGSYKWAISRHGDYIFIHIL